MKKENKCVLMELYGRGISISEAARNVGVSKTTAWRVAKNMGYRGGKSKPRCRKYYTVYLNKNDSIVAAGTAKECAEQMKMSENTFRSSVCHVRNLTKSSHSLTAMKSCGILNLRDVSATSPRTRFPTAARSGLCAPS